MTPVGGGLSIEHKAAGLDWAPSDGVSVPYDAGQAWWLAGASPGHRFRLRTANQTGTDVHPSPIDLRLTRSPSHGAALNGESLMLSLSATIPSGPDLQVTVDIDGAAVDLGCLDAEGWVESCTGAVAPQALSPGAVSLSAMWLAEAEFPHHQSIDVGLWASDVLLYETADEVLLMGRWLYWGDLHAHSNLSHDGCEDLDGGCVTRESLPGSDFFANAEQKALDFVAITEHAEFLKVLPPGESDPEAALSIWAEQQAWAVAADSAGSVLPVMGYEWTLALPDASGGHKTVLLEELESCDARRIRALMSVTEVAHPSGALYFSPNPELAGSAADLWTGLSKASAKCGTGRALTFAHHSAWDPPEWVDWTAPENAPNPLFEPVIEIHSEHASSECADVTMSGCDWGLSTNREHQPNGAVQTALAQGYSLGFVGGTDSHNARPGSIDDGPSCTGRLVDKDGDGFEESYGCHQQDGALTGAYAPSAPLSRELLFDALFARETLATSGPRPPLRVVLTASDGALYLPGAAVPGGAATIHLALDDADLGDMTLLEAGLILPDGSTAAWTDTLPADLSVTLTDETAYVRLQLWDPLASVEHRVWLSPWFFDATAR